MNKRLGIFLSAVMLTGLFSVHAEEEFEIKGDVEQGKAHYKMYCLLCHGEAGKGDGVGAAALEPKPRDLSDRAFQESMTDHYLYTVIKDGGQAVGKSMFMAAFGALLNEQGVHDVAAYVRTLAAE